MIVKLAADPPLFHLFIPPPPISAPFPYTPLFRSRNPRGALFIVDGDERRVPQDDDRNYVEDVWGRTRLAGDVTVVRSEEHTSELQSRLHLVCRVLLAKKKKPETGRELWL